jgi:hypothetical protein
MADGVTVVPFHPKHAQWVKDRVKLLAMVTNQHFAVSDSHALLAQHNNLVRIMRRRCQACINANGGHTRY